MIEAAAAVAGGGALAASLYYYIWGRTSSPPQFGVPLETVEKADSGLPKAVDQVLRSLREDGIRELGIFRQSGSRKMVRELKEQFDLGGAVSLDNVDAHSRGDLLKYFLRELPDPVFPYKVFNLCMDVEKRFRTDQDLQRWIASTKCIIADLPASHKTLLRELCYFLNEVAQHAEVNAMGVTNLATCFGPNMLTTKDSATLQELLDLTPLVTRFILKCIENREQLFEEPQPVVATDEAAGPAGEAASEEYTSAAEDDIKEYLLVGEEEEEEGQAGTGEGDGAER